MHSPLAALGQEDSPGNLVFVVRRGFCHLFLHKGFVLEILLKGVLFKSFEKTSFCQDSTLEFPDLFLLVARQEPY